MGDQDSAEALRCEENLTLGPIDLPRGRRVRGVLQRHGPAMITCGEFEDFVQDYLDGDLPLGKRTIFELHMKFCPECRDYLEAYLQTRDLGQRVFDERYSEVPPSVPEDLVSAVLDALREDDPDEN